MRGITKVFLTTAAIVQLTVIGAKAAPFYQLDSGTIGNPVNASDGTEPLDNWFGNQFTAAAGHNLINAVDFFCYTVTPGTHAQLVLYRVGNPSIGATRIYTQSFTPVPGGGSVINDQHILLTTPLTLGVGDRFIVSVFIPNVIGAPPNDVYPFTIDNATSSVDSFWARSAPGTFNLDDLSGARRLDYALSPGGFIPGGHIMIRADGIAVPEPSTFALAGLGAAAMMILYRRKA